VVETITADARPKSLPARLLGVLTSPRATYGAVAARPRALGALLVVLAICCAVTGTFMSTEVGREALLDQQLRTMESFGMHPTEAQYDRLKESSQRAPVFAVVGQAVGLTFIATVVAGLALAVFNLMGGAGTFRQTFAIVAHSGAVIALQVLFTAPLNYARQSLSSPTNLAVFFPFLDETSFAARLLGGIDLFVIWWIVSLSIGLGVLYKRRTGPIATTIAVVYVLLALVVAGVKTAFSGA
jgi:hypothetical protein